MTETAYVAMAVRRMTAVNLVLPAVRLGFREERIGSLKSYHLHASVESITVNVGGPSVEGCSPPTKQVGVGGPIVVGARENRVQGEGGQLVENTEQNNRMLTGMKFP